MRHDARAPKECVAPLDVVVHGGHALGHAHSEFAREREDGGVLWDVEVVAVVEGAEGTRGFAGGVIVAGSDEGIGVRDLEVDGAIAAEEGGVGGQEVVGAESDGGVDHVEGCERWKGEGPEAGDSVDGRGDLFAHVVVVGGRFETVVAQADGRAVLGVVFRVDTGRVGVQPGTEEGHLFGAVAWLGHVHGHVVPVLEAVSLKVGQAGPLSAGAGLGVEAGFEMHRHLRGEADLVHAASEIGGGEVVGVEAGVVEDVLFGPVDEGVVGVVKLYPEVEEAPLVFDPEANVVFWRPVRWKSSGASRTLETRGRSCPGPSSARGGGSAHPGGTD